MITAHGSTIWTHRWPKGGQGRDLCAHASNSSSEVPANGTWIRRSSEVAERERVSRRSSVGRSPCFITGITSHRYQPAPTVAVAFRAMWATEELAAPSRRAIRHISDVAETWQAGQTDHVEENRRRLAAGDMWGDCGLVFTTRLGDPVYPRNFHRDFKRAPRRPACRSSPFTQLGGPAQASSSRSAFARGSRWPYSGTAGSPSRWRSTRMSRRPRPETLSSASAANSHAHD